MGRSPSCSSKAAGPGGLVTKGPWTEGEDTILAAYIKAHGEGNWRTIPKLSGLSRCGKSCRLRWINYLRPDVKRGNFSPDEDELITKLHALLGNRWSLIAGRIYGRTDNEIKNYWNSHLRRKLCSMGTDPSCHNVSLTLQECSSSELLDEGGEEDGGTSSGQDVTTPSWDTDSPLESSSTASFDRANHSKLDNSMSQDEVYASKPSCNRGEDKKCDMTSHGDCILAAPPLWPAFADHSHKGEEMGPFYSPNSSESVLSYPVTSPPENILSQAEADPFHFAALHNWACGGGEALQPLDHVQPLVDSDFLGILSLESHLQELQGTSWASLSFFDTT